ncbi:hypothetical protein I4U23_005725 [Adineta vaga]|nr:hypothetical protein I4U23_005725 [Adineta vaga]
MQDYPRVLKFYTMGYVYVPEVLPNMAAKMTESDSGEETERRVALITGITGQDGSYLTEFLLAKGYEVHGIVRHSSNFNTARLSYLYENSTLANNKAVTLHYGDLNESLRLVNIIMVVKPTEIYNLAAMSNVKQ